MQSFSKIGLGLGLSLLLNPMLSLAVTPVFAIPHELAPVDTLAQSRRCERWWSIFIDDCNVSDGRDDLLLEPSIPYLITPRNTHIQQTRPLVRWNPVAGVSQHRLQIADQTGFILFNEVVSGSEWQYPDSLPFAPGSTYTLTVFGGGRCSLLAACKAEFTVLTDQETSKLETDLAKLTSSEQSDPLKVADEYQRHKLYGDAIALLENTTPTANLREHHHFLGALYQQVGLYEPALAQYQAALAIAESEGNTRLQAQLSAAMGETHVAIREFEVAIEWFEKAKCLLEPSQVDEIQVLENRIAGAQQAASEQGN